VILIGIVNGGETFNLQFWHAVNLSMEYL
jgi:hypothetical protein